MPDDQMNNTPIYIILSRGPTLFHTLYIKQSSHPHSHPVNYYPHPKGEEMEVQRGRVTCTSLHSRREEELKLKPGSLNVLKPAGRISREGEEERQGIPHRPASLLQHEDAFLHFSQKPEARHSPLLKGHFPSSFSPSASSCPASLNLLPPPLPPTLQHKELPR